MSNSDQIEASQKRPDAHLTLIDNPFLHLHRGLRYAQGFDVLACRGGYRTTPEMAEDICDAAFGAEDMIARFVPLVERAIAGKLTESDAAALRIHLAALSACRQEIEEIRQHTEWAIQHRPD